MENYTFGGFLLPTLTALHSAIAEDYLTGGGDCPADFIREYLDQNSDTEIADAANRDWCLDGLVEPDWPGDNPQPSVPGFDRELLISAVARFRGAA